MPSSAALQSLDRSTLQATALPPSSLDKRSSHASDLLRIMRQFDLGICPTVTFGLLLTRLCASEVLIRCGYLGRRGTRRSSTSGSSLSPLRALSLTLVPT